MGIDRMSTVDLLRKVALGQEPAERVLRNGRWVNVHTGEVLPGYDVAIAAGRIAFVGDASHTIGPDTDVLDVAGAWLVPGLLDAHMHVESTMLTVTEFARAALAHGTTGVFMDPHEIGNVCGLTGVRLMHSEGAGLPLKVFTTIPSCVPAAPLLEDAGAEIRQPDIAQALQWARVAGLSEMMSFPGVIAGDPELHSRIATTLAAGKVVTGHLPLQDPVPIQAYLAAGISSDHECTTADEALTKARLGMTIMIREGSAWQDVKPVIRVLTEQRIDPRACLLVTDDVDAKTLVELGHMNHVVRRAISEGVAPVTAIQMATVQTAQHFHMDADIGSITPGKCADILVVDDLPQMRPRMVLVDGQVVAESGRMVAQLPMFTYPQSVRNSVQLAQPVEAADFFVGSRWADAGRTTVRAIQVLENSALTRCVDVSLPVRNGRICADADADTVWLASFERHRRSGRKAVGFVNGFGLTAGAIASTVAHDSHNLLVAGVNLDDMALAANYLATAGGGLVAVRQGQVLAFVALPIAGLMSDLPAADVSRQVADLEAAWQQLGCTLHAPFMTFSLLALPVIPEVRLTNRGLVDVRQAAILAVEKESPPRAGDNALVDSQTR